MKHRLLHELARGEKQRIQLAEEYGVVPSAITNFAHRHAAELEQIRRDLDNEFAGLWIAQKAARLAEYEQDVNRINDTLDDEERPDTNLMRTKQAALRQVAEELGQIPSKVNLSVEPVTVRYEVVGVETEELE